MPAGPALSIYDPNTWKVWALPVQGQGKLVKICNGRREAMEAARVLNHATPWVFHDVRRTCVGSQVRELYAGDRSMCGPIMEPFSSEHSFAF